MTIPKDPQLTALLLRLGRDTAPVLALSPESRSIYEDLRTRCLTGERDAVLSGVRRAMVKAEQQN